MFKKLILKAILNNIIDKVDFTSNKRRLTPKLSTIGKIFFLGSKIKLRNKTKKFI